MVQINGTLWAVPIGQLKTSVNDLRSNGKSHHFEFVYQFIHDSQPRHSLLLFQC